MMKSPLYLFFGLLGLGVALHVALPDQVVKALAHTDLANAMSSRIPSVSNWVNHSTDPDRTKVGLMFQWLLAIPLIPVSWKQLLTQREWVESRLAMATSTRLWAVPFLLVMAFLMFVFPTDSQLVPKSLSGPGLFNGLDRLALANKYWMALVGLFCSGGFAGILANVYGLVVIHRHEGP